MDCTNGNCINVFDTGSIIDTKNPSNLKMDITGNMCIGTDNDIYVSASDDSGIDYFDFWDNLVFSDTDNFPSCSGSPPDVDCTGTITWRPEAVDGYAAGTKYTITAEAMDMDSNNLNINNEIKNIVYHNLFPSGVISYLRIVWKIKSSSHQT